MAAFPSLCLEARLQNSWLEPQGWYLVRHPGLYSPASPCPFFCVKCVLNCRQSWSGNIRYVLTLGSSTVSTLLSQRQESNYSAVFCPVILLWGALLRNVAWGFLLVIFPRRAQRAGGECCWNDAGTETLDAEPCSPSSWQTHWLAKLSLFLSNSVWRNVEYAAPNQMNYVSWYRIL